MPHGQDLTPDKADMPDTEVAPSRVIAWREVPHANKQNQTPGWVEGWVDFLKRWQGNSRGEYDPVCNGNTTSRNRPHRHYVIQHRHGGLSDLVVALVCTRI